MRNNCYIIRGRGAWCPVAGYMDNAAVALDPAGHVMGAGEWTDITSRYPGVPVRDCDQALIVPGFINAHSHLEYSYLRGAMPRGHVFQQWLAQMVAAKWLTPQETVEAAIPPARNEMVKSGVRSVGEICTSASAIRSLLREPKIRGGRLYGEVICPAVKDWQERWGQFEAVWSAIVAQARFAIGISPHSPYTVGPRSWQTIAEFRRRAGVGGRPLPQVIHCSETRAEVEMMQSGRGELFSFMKERGVMDEDWAAPRCSPVEFLERMRALDSETLLVHCNYLVDGDVEIIRSHGCSVVVCPGTHKWFNHTGHPLRQLLDAGVNVCLGTDSLASNDSLNILREMQLVRGISPGLNMRLSELLPLVTVNGARALGLQPEWGTLQPGAEGGVVVLDVNAPWKTLDDIEVDKLNVN